MLQFAAAQILLLACIFRFPIVRSLLQGATPVRDSLRLRVVLGFAAGLVAFPLAIWSISLRAQEPGQTLMAGGFTPHPNFSNPAEPAHVVHIAAPLTVRLAKTWIKLQKEVALSFPKETPLEQFLLEVRELSKSPEDKKGVSIYVDPVGLQEAEKTLTSPVSLELDDISIATGLTLALKQLGLRYQVSAEGIVMITCESSEDGVSDPMVKVLDELETIRSEMAEFKESRPHEVNKQAYVNELNSLRGEVAELRQTINSLKGAANAGQPAASKP